MLEKGSLSKEKELELPSPALITSHSPGPVLLIVLVNIPNQYGTQGLEPRQQVCE